MNDIEILKEMLVSDAQVPLQQVGDMLPFVELTDTQANTTVEIKGLPRDSIVIRAEVFVDPLTVFEGSKKEDKRADFVIVSNEEQERWIICIETQASDSKTAAQIIAQLRGAQCFMSYCKCIGRSFWELEEFLDGYEYRFISMANINVKKRRTRPFHSRGELHSHPNVFLKILESPRLHFSKLLHEVS